MRLLLLRTKLSIAFCLALQSFWLHADDAQAQSVVLSELSGVEAKGTLQSLSSDQVALSTDKGVVVSPAAGLSRLSIEGNASSTVATFPVVGLVDGSILKATNLSSATSGWNIEGFAASGLKLPNEVIATVQFVNLADQASQSWKELLTSEQTADVLAVIRNGDLETLNGAIVAIDDQAVKFELDGQLIPAPRAKVAGLVFLRRDLNISAKAIDLVTVDGSKLRAKNLDWDATAKVVKVELLCGVSLDLSIDKLSRIEYSSANLQWLDQVEVLERVATNTWDVGGIAESRNKLLAPKFLQDSSASTGSESSHKSLVFQVPGKFVFRVPDGYTQLVSVLQRTRSASVVAPMQITIRSDNQVVWSQEIAGETLRVDLVAKLQPNKRCEIIVESLQVSRSVRTQLWFDLTCCLKAIPVTSPSAANQTLQRSLKVEVHDNPPIHMEQFSLSRRSPSMDACRSAGTGGIVRNVNCRNVGVGNCFRSQADRRN